MNLRKLSKTLVVSTALALNTILFIGLATNGSVVGHSFNFAVLVNVMLAFLITSSVLLGVTCWRKKQKIWSVVFYFNIFIVIVPSMLKHAGLVTFGHEFLFGLDLYWLNLYLLYFGSIQACPTHPSSGTLR